MFGFPFLAIFASIVIVYPVYMVSPCSSSGSNPSYDILDLADVAKEFIREKKMRDLQDLPK